MHRYAAPIALFVSVLTLGCERPELTQGEPCEQNSDCASPLICELDRCRRQCLDSRDCPAGTMCLNVGDRGGACQTGDEAKCDMNSDCTAPLVCVMETCTTECVEDRDCIGEATCEGTACIDPPDECVYNSDCPPGLVCVVGQRCQLECTEDRDCVEPRMCDLSTMRCTLPVDAGI